MRTAQKAIPASPFPSAIGAESVLADPDPERRFAALASESNRRRMARLGAGLIAFGEELQRFASAPGIRRPPSRPRRRLH